MLSRTLIRTSYTAVLRQSAIRALSAAAPTPTPEIRDPVARCDEMGKAEHFKINNKYSLRNLSPSNADGHITDLGPAKLSHGEDYLLFHPVYTEEELKSVKVVHVAPQTVSDKVALGVVQLLRKTSDLPIFMPKNPTEKDFLRRMIFLETIAGVPGMAAAMIRHYKSLRGMERDHGWIHTLLEEAENERMHLLTFLQLRQPGVVFRGVVAASQLVFSNAFFLAYLISPTFCHRFVGYVEEEAVKTYTHALQMIDEGKLPQWEKQAVPIIAMNYWKLKQGATMRDLIEAVRADEAVHRQVNHTFADLQKDTKGVAANPFK